MCTLLIALGPSRACGIRRFAQRKLHLGNSFESLFAFELLELIGRGWWLLGGVRRQTLLIDFFELIN